jgi:transcriptional regulator with XRE-family HTH domain
MTPKEIYLKKVGASIRKERNAIQMKQETLGKKIKLSVSEISKFENGKREIKIYMLLEIAFAIGIPVSSLYEHK